NRNNRLSAALQFAAFPAPHSCPSPIPSYGRIGGFSKMRASQAEVSADRMSSNVTWVAWGLVAAFFTLVALPVAASSPYPTPSRPDWSAQQTPEPVVVASVASFSLASVSSTPVVPQQAVSLVTTVRTVSIRRPIADTADDDDDEIVTASLGGAPSSER